MIHGKLPWRSQRTFPNLGQHILCWTDKQAHTLEPSGLWISTYKHTQILTSHLCHTYSQAFQLKSLFKTWFIQATKGWPSNKPLVWDTTWFRKHFYIRLRSASSASHSPRCSGEEDTVFLNGRAPAATLLNPALAGQGMHNQHWSPACVPSSFYSKLGHLCSDYLSLLTTLL